MEWMVRKMAGKKRGKVKVGKMNSIVAGIDLGDRESLATVRLEPKKQLSHFTTENKYQPQLLSHSLSRYCCLCDNRDHVLMNLEPTTEH